MSGKSYAEMADDILEGALSNPARNPYDPNADKPLMNPDDTLIEMTDEQRTLLMEGVGIETREVEKEKKETPIITEADLDILGKAKEIIERIQEATTVGNLGVNLAGPQKDPKKVKLRSKKRTKKNKGNTNDFLTYLNPR